MHGSIFFNDKGKYGAFSVGISQVERTIKYINNQRKHYGMLGSAQEWKAILKRHGLPVEE
jgi:hypothetical protein